MQNVACPMMMVSSDRSIPAKLNAEFSLRGPHRPAGLVPVAGLGGLLPWTLLSAS